MPLPPHPKAARSQPVPGLLRPWFVRTTALDRTQLTPQDWWILAEEAALTFDPWRWLTGRRDVS